MKNGLRLMVYDATCRGNRYPIGLTHSWITGGAMYRAFGQLDAVYGATSWDDALTWLDQHQPDVPISQIQFWGHGKWGEMLIDRDRFNTYSLEPGHQHHSKLLSIRDRLTPASQFWIRTCETFGAIRGHDFAMQLADTLQCRTAGHTFIIGPWQSGLHILDPGCRPDWQASEGIREGDEQSPKRAYWSTPTAPRTVTCLHMRIPKKWLAAADRHSIGRA